MLIRIDSISFAILPTLYYLFTNDNSQRYARRNKVQNGNVQTVEYAYVEEVKAAGVSVRFEIFNDCYHGFDMLVPNADVSKRAMQFFYGAFAYAVEHYTAGQPS